MYPEESDYDDSDTGNVQPIQKKARAKKTVSTAKQRSTGRKNAAKV